MEFGWKYVSQGEKSQLTTWWKERKLSTRNKVL